MVSQIIQAGKYYHQKFPGSLIFYRIKDSFVAFEEDAVRVAGVLQRAIFTDTEGVVSISLKYNEYFDSVELLSYCGFSCKAIVCRNDEGEFDVPDINILNEDSEDEY